MKTMAEIILKCDCRHTKLMCFIGIAMILMLLPAYIVTAVVCFIGINWEALKTAV